MPHRFYSTFSEYSRYIWNVLKNKGENQKKLSMTESMTPVKQASVSKGGRDCPEKKRRAMPQRGAPENAVSIF
jgi:hypothetical protein